jgi:hypothetical protein
MAQAGGAFQPGQDTEFYGGVKAVGPGASIGYGASTTGLQGATGGAVTQASNRTTGVTLNTLCGTITTNNASLGAELSAEFTVTNSLVSIGDVVVCCQQSGAVGVMTDVYVSTVANGSFKIKVANNNAAAGVAETGAILINFAVIKSVTT